ncbi:hypothetical protein [Lewinella sp. W8]|uniref:hypothetical protein n=1 Tax=Lewinella sp. W8 TaxID=2528208 RepID=UPI0010672ACC|nr:hypothetical protein [Lewinella sp. W8]MTB53028.1 hypothetical protein [Lewinella sp. W8]
MTCNYCKEDFDPKQVARAYGKESAVLATGTCSAACYTKKSTNKRLEYVVGEYPGGFLLEVFEGGKWTDEGVYITSFHAHNGARELAKERGLIAVDLDKTNSDNPEKQ